MAITFRFTLEDPTANQEAQHSIKCYESADGSAGWVLIDTVLVANLPASGDIVTYLCEAADKALYHILSPVSATGAEYPLSVQKIIPPAADNAELCTLFVNMVDIDGEKAAGRKLAVATISGKTSVTSNGLFVGGCGESITNENGFASLAVVADVGPVNVSVEGKSIEFDTTGRAGSAVDLSGSF